jgi:hypothetical protein
VVTGISDLLESARRTTARTINSILAATYWEIGRRIVEYEQAGHARAEYGERLLARLAADLEIRCGMSFQQRTLHRMRRLFLDWKIQVTPSGAREARVILSPPVTNSGASELTVPPDAIVAGPGCNEDRATLDPASLIGAFPLSWTHCIHLMSVADPHARAFYEAEAIRGGWAVRQLDRQNGSGPISCSITAGCGARCSWISSPVGSRSPARAIRSGSFSAAARTTRWLGTLPAGSMRRCSRRST